MDWVLTVPSSKDYYRRMASVALTAAAPAGAEDATIRIGKAPAARGRAAAVVRLPVLSGAVEVRITARRPGERVGMFCPRS